MPITMFQEPPPNFNKMSIESGNDVDKLLIMADNMLVNNRRNGGVIGIAIMRIISGKRYGLRYIETRYRSLQSQTFLIAKPKHLTESRLDVVGLDGKPRPYFLWVCVNGQSEANDTLAEIGMNYDSNIANLDRTGFLVMERN